MQPRTRHNTRYDKTAKQDNNRQTHIGTTDDKNPNFEQAMKQMSSAVVRVLMEA